MNVKEILNQNYNQKWDIVIKISDSIESKYNKMLLFDREDIYILKNDNVKLELKEDILYSKLMVINDEFICYENGIHIKFKRV